MNSVAVLPFRFGRNAAQAIEQRALEFYRAIAPCIFGPNCALHAQLVRETIPLYAEMSVSTELVQLAAARMARSWNSIDKVIIDLTSTATYELPTHHVVGGLLSFIDHEQAHRQRSYVLLIPMMFAAEDVNMSALAPFIDREIVALVSDNGDHLGLRSVFSHFHPNEYRTLLAAARPSRISVLRKKLIRFPGHFVRHTNGAHTHCVEFFFDGRLFERELVDAFAEWISIYLAAPEGCKVFYDAPVSPWLESAVLGLKERFGIEVVNFAKLAKANSHHFTGPLLLIVPLIDTGATIRRLVQFIREHGYDGRITILAVLSTAGDKDHEGELSLSVRGEEFQIRYLLKVDQTRINREDCLLCASNVAQGDPLNPDPYLTIPTQAFWKIALELGIDEEQNVPDNRSSLGPIPQFSTVTEASSAYLAYKIEGLLRSLPEGRPSEVTIICPDEDGAAAIAECLDSIFRMTVIRIPKSILRRVQTDQGGKLVEYLFREYERTAVPEWLMQLQSLRTVRNDLQTVQPAFGSSGSRIVILDEINVSGSTRRALALLANAFDLDVVCRLSVIDFAYSPGVPEERCLSLYQIPRRLASSPHMRQHTS